MKILKRYIPIIAVILGLVMMLFYRDKREEDKEYAEVFIKEYPDIENYLNSGDKWIKGIVTYKVFGKKNYLKGAAYFTLNTGEKFRIGTRTDNYLYSPSELMHFIEVNDSISKPSGDDLFLVYRGGERYFF